ncbi:MAG TPA: hypothetical protein VGN72_15105 [Tepidisphaeraceae bacterium]|jgi:hypothetical protein|nr:hypothetical protein [Tepidisphaeraceae bacterium]
MKSRLPLVPPTELRDFSLIPFWFWNDALDEQEIVRQIRDFQAHGVHGFLIHPRVGLPRDIAFMSDRFLHFVQIAVAEAARLDMRVVLYDEGMYPSGSASGQVVATNAAYQCRGLSAAESDDAALPLLSAGQTHIATARRANGRWLHVIDRPVDSVIRGLHYLNDAPTSTHSDAAEETPPAADLLNAAAVQCFIRLVYDRFYDALRPYFGKTIIGLFTDEPDLLGRLREPRALVRPGTSDILAHVNAHLGYDFAPHLPALWFDDEPDAARYRADYARAVNHRLEQTYYAPLSRWCAAHGVSLMGHPAQPDEIGLMKYFHVPGQDLVWRWVMPGEANALEGPQSTQAKCSSSAMIHLGRRRNSNEFCGAYGHELTFPQMKWLADWCHIRGVNQLIPHAFYYSVRGPRRDERPPDVGPNSPWWDSDFPALADHCARLCWLNTDSVHQCDVAILGWPDHLPWRAAKACFERQIDFNYLDMQDIIDGRATVDEQGVHIGDMHYKAIVIDAPDDAPAVWPGVTKILQTADLERRLIHYRDAIDCVSSIDAIVEPDVLLEPAQPSIRVRHVVKAGQHYRMFFHEGMEASVQFIARSRNGWTSDVRLNRWELAVL